MNNLTPGDAGVPETNPATRISEPYLLVLFGVVFHVDAAGRRSIDPLWAKDLVEHTRYIDRLTLAAPARSCEVAPSGNLEVDRIPGLAGLRCVDLPAPRSFVDALRLLPRTLHLLWRELGPARLVHTAVAGWPIPEAWLIVPLLWLRPRILFVNVESAFWRTVPGQRTPWPRRLRAAITERLNRACVERADLSTFTHRGYQRSLLRRRPERGHVIEASWIDEAGILTEPELAAALERRRNRREGPLRLVFAGRLVHEKGIRILVEAAGAAVDRGVPLEVDIFGVGPAEQECRDTIDRGGWAAAIRLRGTVDYGAAFFELLRTYDALVVPSLTDEQPRIVFDAFSQGLPVLASKTDGLIQCVEDGVTGALFIPGDVAQLTTLIATLGSERETLEAMAAACVRRARSLTHQQMHRVRRDLLVARFPRALTGIGP